MVEVTFPSSRLVVNQVNLVNLVNPETGKNFITSCTIENESGSTNLWWKGLVLQHGEGS